MEKGEVLFVGREIERARGARPEWKMWSRGPTGGHDWTNHREAGINTRQ